MHRATVGKISTCVEKRAPRHWAESWDNVGLQVGDPERPVSRVLVALELTDSVLAEAEAAGADLILVHHPAIFKPLQAIRLDTAAGRRLERMLRGGIALYAAHTNLDQAFGGTNDTLAAAAGLQQFEVLAPVVQERYLKLVVFVPRGHEDAVRNALADAGAGHIGNYSHCTFQTEGTGTFLPLEGAQPFTGQQGQVSHEAEWRLETILPESLATAAVAALIAAHPYEEVAYDLYPLANPGRPRGHGRLGRLPAPVTLAELAATLKARLGVRHVRLVGPADRPVQQIAVAAGSGGQFLADAARRGAQVLITGDLDHHDALDALDLGLALLDVGHWASERIVVPPLAAYLRQQMQAEGLTVDVLEAQSETDPFTTL